VVGPTVQMRLATSLTDEDYVSQCVWLTVQAPRCGWCKASPHRLAPHGFYPRVQPRGTWIRRFICRTVGRTVSCLPDCFAAWVKGSLEELEEPVRAALVAVTQTAAAEQARPPGECSLASAQRWLRQRQQWVQEALVTVKGLYPERFEGVHPSLAEFGQKLGSKTVLRKLREVAEAQLGNLSAPLGFRRMSSAEVGNGPREQKKQARGLSPPTGGG